MKIERVEGNFSNSLLYLVLDYFKEVHKEDNVSSTLSDSRKFLTSCIRDSKALYVLVDDTETIGFLLMSTNDQYGMTKMVVTTDYMYIKPIYRSGESILYLYTMAGIVSDDLGCDNISTTFTSSSNIGNNKRVDGELIAQVYKFPLEKQREKLKKYKKRLKYEI